jgi:hypothetical protein
MRYFKSISALSVFFITIQLFAQQNAVTDDGKKVILNGDGTWQYVKERTEPAPVSVRPLASTELIKSDKIKFGVYYNKAHWSLTDEPLTPACEFSFKHKKGDAYVMAITERIGVPLETLRQLALNNFKEKSTKMEVLDSGYKYVNGIKILTMKVSATVNGINVIYYGYYYGSDTMTVQLLAFTGAGLYSEYKDDIFELLDGFTIFKD